MLCLTYQEMGICTRFLVNLGMGRGGDGGMGGWGDGEMGRQGDGEMGRWGDKELLLITVLSGSAFYFLFVREVIRVLWRSLLLQMVCV